MTLEQETGSIPDHEQDLEAHGYRPSVKLPPHEELRLLDEALEEAKARPRPPQVSYAAPPVPVRPRAIAAAINPPAIPQQVEDRRPVARAAQPDDRHGVDFDEDQGPYLGRAEDDEAAGREPPRRRRRIDFADVMAFADVVEDDKADPDEAASRSGVDRKRLLAAIICILQEELTRSNRSK